MSTVEAIVSDVDSHFMRGLNTTTDGWSVDFFPPCICSTCRQEFPNRCGLKFHYCSQVYNTSAVDWDEDGSDDASESDSEPGTYGDDGLWHPDSQSDDLHGLGKSAAKDSFGRTALWRAAAVGNTALVRKLIASGAEVDALDNDGVTPLLAAVRRGHYFSAEELLWAGADKKPWQFTKRKGKKWSSSRASRYERLLEAVRSGRWLCKTSLRISGVSSSKTGKSKKKR